MYIKKKGKKYSTIPPLKTDLVIFLNPSCLYNMTKKKQCLCSLFWLCSSIDLSKSSPC